MTGGRVPWTRWLGFWCLALGGAAIDLMAKSWIFRHVGPPGSAPVSLVGDILEFRTTRNTGALWGIGNALPYGSLMFAVMSILAGLAIWYWLFVKGGAQDRWLTFALGLIMAGAIGNCFDRLRFGHVRDFIHFHVDSVGFNFAIFNLADSFLVMGAGVLIVLALRADTPVPASAAASEPREEASLAALQERPEA